MTAKQLIKILKTVNTHTAIMIEDQDKRPVDLVKVEIDTEQDQMIVKTY